MRRRFSIEVWWLLGLLVAVGAARADKLPGARQHYERGTALYDLRRYREAAVEYEAAFEIKNDPALLFNIAQAYRLAGDYEAALRSYRAYLRRAGDAPNRAEVERHLAEVQAQLDAQKRPAVVLSPPPAASGVTAPRAPDALGLQQSRSAAPPATPIYKKWWLWTAVGVVVAGAVTGAALAATLPKDAPIPGGAAVLQFH